MNACGFTFVPVNTDAADVLGIRFYDVPFGFMRELEEGAIERLLVEFKLQSVDLQSAHHETSPGHYLICIEPQTLRGREAIMEHFGGLRFFQCLPLYSN